MYINWSFSNLTSSRFCRLNASESCKKRSHKHRRCSQFSCHISRNRLAYSISSINYQCILLPVNYTSKTGKNLLHYNTSSMHGQFSITLIPSLRILAAITGRHISLNPALLHFRIISVHPEHTDFSKLCLRKCYITLYEFIYNLCIHPVSFPALFYLKR